MIKGGITHGRNWKSQSHRSLRRLVGAFVGFLLKKSPPATLSPQRGLFRYGPGAAGVTGTIRPPGVPARYPLPGVRPGPGRSLPVAVGRCAAGCGLSGWLAAGRWLGDGAVLPPGGRRAGPIFSRLLAVAQDRAVPLGK